MPVSDDRARKLFDDAIKLRTFYRSQGGNEIVTLYAEDFDFLKKRKDIVEFEAVDGFWFEGQIEVRRGARKKKLHKRRPPEFEWA